MSRLIEGQAKADRPAPGELAGNRSALGRVVVRTPLLLATNPWWLSLGHGFAIPMLPAGPHAGQPYRRGGALTHPARPVAARHEERRAGRCQRAARRVVRREILNVEKERARRSMYPPRFIPSDTAPMASERVSAEAATPPT
jgi:hypothetical protein